MSSINIINRCTKSNNGGGLPFYEGVAIYEPEPPAPFFIENLKFFSAVNNGFNSDVGLWYVPTDKVPTFQLFTTKPTFSSITYMESLGGGNFTGASFGLPSSVITITPITRNGVTEYVYQTDDSTPLLVAAPEGRWVLRMITTGTYYYSEEFITKNC